MTPGIWTSMRLGFGAADDVLRALAADGWRAFELSTEHLREIDESPDKQAKIEQVRRVLAELGATMPQAHARLRADVAAEDADIRRRDVDELARHVDYGAALGVKNVVIHPGKGEGHTNDAERQRIIMRNIEAFRPLADRAAAAGMRIALENMEWVGRDDDGKPRRFGYTAAELVALVEAIDHPAVGICIDTSHANLQKTEALSVGETIRVFGKHICATHISDNRGDRDAHLIPGHGEIDWPDVMAALRDAGYDGIFNLEIPGDKHAVDELLRLKSQHALRVAEWLVGPPGRKSP